jgi:hypothetical protein
VRYAWIEQHRDDYAVSRMCRLLLVSRSGYLQWRRRPPSARAQANARLDARVAAMHAASKGSYVWDSQTSFQLKYRYHDTAAG